MLLRSIGAVVALLLAAPALAAPAPREVAGRVAQAVEDHYFDPAKAKTVAEALRAEAAAGAFDRLTDPRDLASALTRKLAPSDGHFNVAYDPAPPSTPPAVGEPGPPPDHADRQRRAGYGFRRVEMRPGALGYIDLRQAADFDPADPLAPARRAADAALALVANADAVILDLRDNGGGSPAMVGYLVSAFTPKGADIYNTFHGREGTESEAPPAPYPTPMLQTPLYVLVSARTGSAAESIAYTLQAARRATVVGERTAGGANPGGPVPVGDGFSVFVSQGTPINPITGQNWEGVGVAPDVAVPAADALARAERLSLEAVLAKGGGDPGLEEARWALDALKALENPLAGIGGLDLLAGTYGDVTVRREGASLILARGRRPPATLIALGDSTFFFEGEPARRAAFLQDDDGRATALEIRYAGGPVLRYRRD